MSSRKSRGKLIAIEGIDGAGKATQARAQKRDGHEKNIAHLKRAARSYRRLAAELPKSHILVRCMHENRPLPPEKVHDEIWNTTRLILSSY